LKVWGDSLVEGQLKEDLCSGSIAHAYLMSGRSSEEKKEIVMFFVQGLLCLDHEDGHPCDSCVSCRAWLHQAHPDYHYLQPEGASLKMEQVRLWQSFFRYRPNLGRHQVFLLEQPELLTASAANSLLKILEEPLPGTVFLLVTGDERSLLPTIVSRCRVVYFKSSGEKLKGEPGDDIQEVDRFLGIVQKGTPAELLKEVRLLGSERSTARSLLKGILTVLEQEYRLQRTGHKGDTLVVCLRLVLEGVRQLEENASVPLVLSLTLYQLQREVQKQYCFGK
jgi:DNA polymerase-3 subunit delta'